MRGGVRELLADLRAAGSIALARKARMRLRTPEKVFGVLPSSFKAVLARWSRCSGGPPGRPELAELFGSGVFEARLAAIELALIAYGGRKQLDIARAAIQEAGTIRLATEQGDLTGNYLLRSMKNIKVKSIKTM